MNSFIHEQLYGDGSNVGSNEGSDDSPPYYDIASLSVFHSAIATFYAPSDLSGVGGMHTEWIRAAPNWRKSYPRYDTVLLEKDPDLPGFRGMHVGRVLLFFSFTYAKTVYPCALVHWFVPVQDVVDEDTGLWMVEPEYLMRAEPSTSVIHLETIIRSTHLLPVFSRNETVRDGHHFSNTLDLYQAFYVNKYADHHSFEIIY